MLLAVLVAASPWIGMSGGPLFVKQQDRAGVGTGPMVRLELGVPFAERAAAEAWLSGAVETAPLGAPGDSAIVGAGGGGRFLLARIDPDGRVGFWAHAGAGWGAFTAGEGAPGISGFAGALLSFQPFLKRFRLGLEADAVAYRKTLGLAILPSLSCTF
jgi:hypothetical protein